MSRRYLAFTALAATFSSLSYSPRVFRRASGGGGVLTSSLGVAIFSRSVSCASQSTTTSSVSFLDAATAQAIDAELMGETGGFKLEQLMELAGLSVASAAQVT
jgi:hypothetical protein